MKKYIVTIAILALGLTACNKEKESLQETQEQTPAVLAEAPVCYFNLPASFGGDGATKAVTIGENTATTTFASTDKVYVVIEHNGTYAIGYDPSESNCVSMTVTPDANPAIATLSGALKFYYDDNGTPTAFTPAKDDVVYMLYNMSDPFLPANSSSFNYIDQNGSLDQTNQSGFNSYYGVTHHDYAQAKMKITEVNGNTTDGFTMSLVQYDDDTKSYVSFQNLGSIFRQQLSFTDKNGNPVTPTLTKFTISTATVKTIFQYIPFINLHLNGPVRIDNPQLSIGGDIYFALMFKDDNKNEALILTAEDENGNVYTCSKAAPASGFANGKYYYGTATLAWQKCRKPTVTGTSATPNGYSYSITENPVALTISGNSEDYDFVISDGHGGTITLDNVTATNSNDHFIGQENNDNTNGDISLVLTGTNSISCNTYRGILVYGNLKLSCTGASATLTITARSGGTCGISAANYRSDIENSNPSWNYWDTTTELDVSALLAAPGFTVTRSARVDGPDADTDGAPDYYTWTYTVRKSGEFSVSDNKKVYFSPGNLQATTTDYGTHWTWAFAANQWNYIGYAIANKKIDGNGTVSDNGTVDLFGWVGASSGFTGAAMYGISKIENNSDYGNVAEENLKRDWGETIGTGWRTLTKDEWVWLLGPTISPDPGTNCRTSSTVGGTANGRYAKATVNSVPGLILFPDSYTHPDGLTAPASVNTNNAAYNANNYDATAWGKMEAAGAVFLPAAGVRSGNNVTLYGESGNYWSSSSPTSPVNNAYYMYFTAGNVKPDDYSGRRLGLSVRLVYNAN